MRDAIQYDSVPQRADVGNERTTSALNPDRTKAMPREVKRVLMVDDDLVDVMAVRRIVTRLELQAEVVNAEDGVQALGWIARQRTLPCCVLLDLNMPRMNGHEVLKHLRADPRTESLPVYVITTSTRDEDILVCRENGCTGYLVKSTRIEEFTDAMSTLLRDVCRGPRA